MPSTYSTHHHYHPTEFFQDLYTVRCWFKISATSWVKSETGPITQRARQDREARQTTPDWWMAVLISEELIYKARLGHRKTK